MGLQSDTKGTVVCLQHKVDRKLSKFIDKSWFKIRSGSEEKCVGLCRSVAG